MHPSAISSELTRSGLRAPQPSPMRAPRGTRPNSDDDDDDDDDVRLTHSHSCASSEAGHPNRDRDCDVRPSAPAPSSSQPKSDNTSVPAAAATPNPNVPFSLSLILRNTGSVARDHLASERTFLAYVRTSLSFASAGVGPSHLFCLFLKISYIHIHIALVQLFRVSVSASTNGSSTSSHDQLVVSSYARPLGATLIAFGMAVLVMGESRRFSFALPSPSP